MKLKNMIYVLFFFLIIKGVFAIGISPGDIVLNFEPELSTAIEYTIVNTMPFEIGAEISFGGPLSEYMSLSQTYIKSLGPHEMKKVTLNIKLPERIEEPGMHRHTLTVVEQRSVEGASGMVARGGVIDNIDIWVLYSEKYPIAEFTAFDASSNDTAKMQVRIWNYGAPTISLVSGYAEIMNLEGQVIDKVTLGNIFNIQSFESKDMEGYWITLDAAPGVHKARAVLNADGQRVVTNEDKFNIGELNLKLLGYTQSVYQEQINNFELFVENRWNHEVKGVFAQVFVTRDGKFAAEIQTVDYDFAPWEKKTMTSFLNTAGLEPGTYDVEILISYMGKTTRETGNMKLLKKPFPIMLVLIVSANAAVVLFTMMVVILTVRKKKK